MPVHDWTRVDAGIFHDFHQAWTIAIRNALNTGGLPDGYYAMAEQVLGGPIPDVITLHAPETPRPRPVNGGVAIAERPPRTRFTHSAQPDIYAARANRIVIRHQLGEVVAIIEVVSPGNKDSWHAIRTFVNKTRELLDRGVHLLVVDLFPPSPRDPQGIHKAIWDEIEDVLFQLPADKPLTLAAYLAGELKTAYVEPIAVGDTLPDMPIFLSTETYVPAPLESTYQATWDVCPKPMKALLACPPT
jgi:hypothetical protein